jgi:pimeloyl-ACP methyl ester carboxylesterase
MSDMKGTLINDISLNTETGKVYGTLEIPSGGVLFPVVLIISGSGPTDRDGNSLALPGKNDSLKLLAKGLLEHGYASLRYDKRGIAASVASRPPEDKMTLDVFVEDAAAFLKLLKHDIHFNRFIVIGHSEGSLIGMLAAQKVPIDAYISLEGAGQPAQDTIVAQLRTQLPEHLLKEVRKILTQLVSGQIVSPLPDEISQVSTLASLFKVSIQPYLISWFHYDPAQELSKLKCPSLVIQGTTDMQVSIADAERLAAAKSDVQLATINDMNHVLKEAPADPASNLAEYSDPNLPLATGLLDSIINFLDEKLQGEPFA